LWTDRALLIGRCEDSGRCLVTVVIAESYRIVFLHVGDGFASRRLCLTLLAKTLLKKFPDHVGHLLPPQSALTLDTLMQRQRDVDRQPLHRLVRAGTVGDPVIGRAWCGLCGGFAADADFFHAVKSMISSTSVSNSVQAGWVGDISNTVCPWVADSANAIRWQIAVFMTGIG